MRFSLAGPEFPNELIQSFLDGEAVFLCGAGVSKVSGLPLFSTLTDRIFARIGEAKSAAEELSYGKGRFEECLGTLARRIANPADIEGAVTNELEPAPDADLSAHKIIIRLSRDTNNRIAIVTTNFDGLFERALRDGANHQAAKISFAGQALPAPGGKDFGGIIHLHGRVATHAPPLERTPLVLTSADYGDAYLRSGWAARFLFDLARCRTLVLIGYSAEDPPVRYILNVLEADRERFPDLRKVYAFDGARNGQEADIAARWHAVAVEPLIYSAGMGDAEDHSALWSDLSALADVVEKPRIWRERLVRDAVAQPYAAAHPMLVDQVVWALRQAEDLWDPIAETVRDPGWIERFFADNLLPRPRLKSWFLARWASCDWKNRQAFLEVLQKAQGSGPELGPQLATDLEFRLNQVQPDAPLWEVAWRLLAVMCREQGNPVLGTDFVLHDRLARPDPLDADLVDAVSFFRPRVRLGPPWNVQEVADPPQAMRDICRVEFEVGDQELFEPQLLRIAGESPARSIRLATLALHELRVALESARDAGRITSDFDASTWDVPAVEDHPQNEHHRGFLPITRLAAALIEIVAKHDPRIATRMAFECIASDFLLIVRLALHVFRNATVAQPDPIIEAVLSIPREHFWEITRELPLLIRDRGRGASSALLERLKNRICRESPDLFPPREGDAEALGDDWRERVRARAAWRLLSPLLEVGYDGADAPLEEIRRRYPFLNRPLEDPDLFSVWSGEARPVQGDPTSFTLAAPTARVERVIEGLRNPGSGVQGDWEAFCREDPEGALHTLQAKPNDLALAEAWSTLLRSLNVDGTTNRQVREDRHRVLRAALEHLETQDDHLVDAISFAVLRALEIAAYLGDALDRDWWDRLWQSAVRCTAEVDFAEAEDLHSRSINQTAGRLAELLLRTIDHDRKVQREVIDDIRRFHRIIAENQPAGGLARAATLSNLSFIQSLDPTLVDEFARHLQAPTAVGKSLRAIYMRQPIHLNSDQTRRLQAVIRTGASESTTTGVAARNTTSKLIGPLLLGAETRDREDWGISPAEVRGLLSGSETLREAGAAFMADWLGQRAAEERAQLWTIVYGPIFESIWPRTRAFVTSQTACSLARLAINAREAFPDALQTLNPYLTNVEHRSFSISTLLRVEDFDTASQFPRETLELLWKVVGDQANERWHKLDKVLVRIVAARADLENDRRLQRLLQRTAHH